MCLSRMKSRLFISCKLLLYLQTRWTKKNVDNKKLFWTSSFTKNKTFKERNIIGNTAHHSIDSPADNLICVYETQLGFTRDSRKRFWSTALLLCCSAALLLYCSVINMIREAASIRKICNERVNRKVLWNTFFKTNFLFAEQGEVG